MLKEDKEAMPKFREKPATDSPKFGVDIIKLLNEYFNEPELDKAIEEGTVLTGEVTDFIYDHRFKNDRGGTMKGVVVSIKLPKSGHIKVTIPETDMSDERPADLESLIGLPLKFKMTEVYGSLVYGDANGPDGDFWAYMSKELEQNESVRNQIRNSYLVDTIVNTQPSGRSTTFIRMNYDGYLFTLLANKVVPFNFNGHYDLQTMAFIRSEYPIQFSEVSIENGSIKVFGSNAAMDAINPETFVKQAEEDDQPVVGYLHLFKSKSQEEIMLVEVAPSVFIRPRGNAQRWYTKEDAKNVTPVYGTIKNLFHGRGGALLGNFIIKKQTSKSDAVSYVDFVNQQLDKF
ncbi:hypothetical protein JOC36_001473 [Weissella uvarum]|uniref:hypothetical protein n=1 Tax=Weissella uvarum TaxID=1479233 RepID=UPI001960AFD8|nr:hypothetical protein [Weissella uvarum]MBM7617880.1 hypothetical protein [Weissella uvarum]MCM0596122.1 hypothetical protein [Weissella uvarum]